MKKLNLSEEFSLMDNADGADIKDKLEKESDKDLAKINKDLEKTKKEFKKLTLSEDFEETPIEEVHDDNLGDVSLISALIKGEWETIDLYNSIILNFRQVGNKEAETVLGDIVSEEYIHIGQLEKLAQMINPVANSIETGQQEAESQGVA